MSVPIAAMIDQIVTDLAGPGWSVCANFMPAECTAALARECVQKRDSGGFRAARVGIGGNLQLRPEIRSDQVHWLDENALSPAQQDYFTAIENLRRALNQQLYLGLFEFEAHLTVYPSGAHYLRHLDRFRGSEHRVVSCILYLNHAWQPAHGGQLRLHPASSEPVDVAPTAGTLVSFLSESMSHEVLESRQPRLSVTGWLCLRR